MSGHTIMPFFRKKTAFAKRRLPYKKSSNSKITNPYTKRRVFSRAPRGLRSKIGSNITKTQMLNTICETKLQGLASAYEAPPVAIQLGAQGRMYNMVLGGVPSAWSTSSWNNLGGMPNQPGIGASERVGDYAFLQKTTLSAIIDFNRSTTAVPVEFRIICAKPNRKYDPAGLTNDPYRTICLNEQGIAVGPATSGITLPNLYMAPLNRKNFTIVSDQKFTMQAPVSVPAATGTGVQASYIASSGLPSSKTLQFSLPHYRKAQWNGANILVDYDPHYFVMVLARSVGQDQASDGWEISYRGTTSYLDN